MTNSRNKGASFEREVANLLTNDLNLSKNINYTICTSVYPTDICNDGSDTS